MHREKGNKNPIKAPMPVMLRFAHHDISFASHCIKFSHVLIRELIPIADMSLRVEMHLQSITIHMHTFKHSMQVDAECVLK